MTKISCGIDFGTSNSSVALADNGSVILVPVEGNHITIPTAIFFAPGKAPSFGRSAVRMFFDNEQGRFMRSIKRVLGTSLMKQGTTFNGKPMKFENIIGVFLTNLKSRTLEFTGKEINDVVIGRPVHFIDNDPEGDIRAQSELESIARSVGFVNVSFQYEPIAAAFAHERKFKEEKLALVADLGGGTSDFTIIKLSSSYIEKSDRSSDILANTGVRVGGNDFDKHLCLSTIMPEIGYLSTYGSKDLEVPMKYFHDLSEWSKVNFLYTPKVLSQVRQYLNESHDKRRLGRLLTILEKERGHLLLSAAEESKIALTNAPFREMYFDWLEDNFAIQFTQEQFNSSIHDDVVRIANAAAECLLKAQVKSTDVNLLILTGGSTEVPLVQTTFRKLFPHAAVADDNKLSSVGMGLAFESHRRFR
jgi:hypothetical chaperone protein